MRRIRTIKPEFWQDEKLAPLPPTTRLVFLGLLSMADDAGRLVDNVKAIDGFLFGATRDTAKKSLEVLADAGRILRYQSASGQALIQIVGWHRHQKVDKPAKYTLPPPDGLAGTSREPRENGATSSRSDQGPCTKDQGPSTGDHGPTTTSAASDDEIGGEVESSSALWARFRTHVVTYCGEESWPSWAAEVRVARQGMHGPAISAEQLRQAVSDYVGNGSRPNLMLFRGYLERAARPAMRVVPTTAPSRPGEPAPVDWLALAQQIPTTDDDTAPEAQSRAS